VHLEVVVPTAKTLTGHEAATGVLLPTATRHVLDLAEQGSQGYVARLAARLATEGLRASASVSRGDPATCLLEAADRVAADFVVLATHARGAMAAFWAGSLTPKVMTALHRPILLVRAEGEDRPA
jgi:nucleotide-binding universal stress UspA family protein